VGTIKSRVSRARRSIMVFMEGEEAAARPGDQPSPGVEASEDRDKPRRIARL
jgi:hypothetical protein